MSKGKWVWEKVKGYARAADVIRRADELFEQGVLPKRVPRESLDRWFGKAINRETADFPVDVKQLKKIKTGRGTNYLYPDSSVLPVIFFLDARRRGEDWKANLKAWRLKDEDAGSVQSRVPETRQVEVGKKPDPVD